MAARGGGHAEAGQSSNTASHRSPVTEARLVDRPICTPLLRRRVRRFDHHYASVCRAIAVVHEPIGSLAGLLSLWERIAEQLPPVAAPRDPSKPLEDAGPG